jgi:Ca-activated chloride channel family protein
VAGRVALRGAPLTFHLRSAGTDVLAECTVDPSAEGVPGLKALFGAQRIRRLEYLMYSGLPTDELRTELDRLGYNAGLMATESKVYAENERKAATDLVRPLLIREALESGLPSAETAFVAVRSEAGQQVGGTVVVANALPAGWDNVFLNSILSANLASIGGGGGYAGGGLSRVRAPRAMLSDSLTSTPPQAPAAFAAMARGGGAVDYDEETVGSGAAKCTRITIAAGRHPAGASAVLFDSDRDTAKPALPPAGRLTSVALSFADRAVTADAVGANLKLLIFAGDTVEPRARVGLADVLRQGGSRPLNIRWKAGQVIRLTVEDPDGRWQGGVPALEITLHWEG